MKFLSHLKWENLLKIYIRKIRKKNDDMAANVTQCKCSNIKCYASTFSNTSR